MKKILIYQDYVYNNGILHKRLAETFGAAHVSFCDADDIRGGILTSDIFLFVMPGGADLYYCEKLKGEGNVKIRAYVENGGNYLGICAGAYYACNMIDWAKGEIAGKRELGFFSGKATGPIYDLIEDGNIGKSWDGFTWVTSGARRYPVLYSGGPIFTSENNNGYEVLASYEMPGNPIAVLKLSKGNGTVLLSSPHIESRPEDCLKKLYAFDPSHAWKKNICEKFAEAYDGRHDLWDAIMNEYKI